MSIRASSANANTAKGIWKINPIGGSGCTDQLLKPEQYAPLIVDVSKRAPVRLTDIAKVTEGIEDLEIRIFKRQTRSG